MDGCPWPGVVRPPTLTPPARHLVLDTSAPANLDHRGSWPGRGAHTAALACLVGGVAEQVQPAGCADAGSCGPGVETQRLGLVGCEWQAHGHGGQRLGAAEGPGGSYDSYEPIDTRPRVRVYGCCLPIALGGLLAFLATAALLVNLVIAVQ